MVGKIFGFFFLFLIVFQNNYIFAQDVDNNPSDLHKKGVRDDRREKDTTKGRFSTEGDNYQLVEDSDYLNDTAYVPPTKNPKLAGWMSFVVPGSGQIYNGQYWKVPIIYGAVGSLIYVSNFYNLRYKQMKNDERYYLAQSSGDSSFVGRSIYGLTNESDIVYYMKKYRRYRDMCYIGMFLVYMMNIFDAVVDAHLYDYDVTDDISLRLEPFTSGPLYTSSPVFGARLVVRF